MVEEKKEFIIEQDVLEVGGSETLQKIAKRGNSIYIDFEKLEQGAEDKKNHFAFACKSVLAFISENGEIDLENKKYIMSSGGEINWGKPKNKNCIHITKQVSTKSRLLREGKIVQFPKSLQYGLEILSAGFTDIEYNDDISKPDLNRILEENEIEPINNQFFRLNKKLIWQYQEILKEKTHNRFEIDEDKEGRLVKFERGENTTFPNIPQFRTRNLEQEICVNNLMNPNIDVHIIVGGSGSGKTLLAYAAAVSHILGNEKERDEQKILEQILLFKSNDIIGGKNREMGFLPGDAFDKNLPYMKSYIDVHNLCGLKGSLPFEAMLAEPRKPKTQKQIDDLKHGIRDSEININGVYLPKKNPAIEIEYLQFARGRTFENKFIIVDEAQNKTPFEIKQLIERVGIGSKLVLVGDPYQLDNPRLTPEFNGLVYAANSLIEDYPKLSITNLVDNYRHQVAETMRNKFAPND